MADVTWQPTVVALSALVPWDRNPKRISKGHAKRLLDLWQRLGQFQTIAIGPAGEVYDGHQRLSVLKAAHGPRFQVQALQADRALTEKEREELTVAAHVGTTGQFDWDELSGWDTTDLQTWGFDAELLQDWNTGAAALATMLESAQDAPPEDPGAQIDRAEELREKWQTAPGQMWQLGEHRLICGDCTDAAVVARVMGEDVAMLMVTDPPYGVGYDPMFRQEALGAADRRTGRVQNDNRSDWRDAWLLFGGDIVYCWAGMLTTSDVLRSFELVDFCVHAEIVWVKPHIPFGRGHYVARHESCWYMVRNGKTAQWNGDGIQTTVWDIALDATVDGGHGTQKPIECMEHPIRNHSASNVYDPFLGSGTTLIACERLNRRCRGVEISPAYVAVTLQRWADMTGGEPVLLD